MADPGNGDVYVAETSGETIRKYDAEGNLITSWGNNGVFEPEIFGTGGLYNQYPDSFGGIAVTESTPSVDVIRAAAAHRGRRPHRSASASSGVAEPVFAADGVECVFEENTLIAGTPLCQGFTHGVDFPSIDSHRLPVIICADRHTPGNR